MASHGGEHLVSADRCRAFVAAIMAAAGAPQSFAARWAELLVETSLLGVDSHGVRMTERYVDHVVAGGINPAAQPTIERDRGACVAMDAHGGLGHLSADHASTIAIERANVHGLSCVTMRGGNHAGACGLYVRRAAAADCVAMCTAVSRPGVAPWGGREAMIGINPLAIAAPIEGLDPFAIDMSTTVTAMGKVTRAADAGESIPLGWALDSDGNPTTDPAAAATGSLMPIGGHKGYGLAMAMEILAGMLTDGAVATDVKSWIAQKAEPTGAGFTIIVLNIASLLDPDRFRQRMRDWVESLIASPRRDGVERICYPGQIAGETRRGRQQQGIPLEALDRAMFARLAERFNVASMESPSPEQ